MCPRVLGRGCAPGWAWEGPGGAGRRGGSATITGPWLCVGGDHVHIGECVHMGIQGNCGQFEGSCEAQGPGRDGGAGEVTSAKVQREE